MKNALLVISFGSSMDHVINKYIEPVEDYLEHIYSDMKIQRAFTSNFIRHKLNNKGHHILSVTEALDKLIEEGYEHIILQPLHIIAGFEFEKIKKAYDDYKDRKGITLRLSTPLLFHNNDYPQAVQAISPHLPELNKDEALLFMGHGTKHQANASYFSLTYYLKEENQHYYLANVEETPDLDHIIKNLKSNGYKKIYLMPFMLVAGDHALNDMASDEDDSWKSILLGEGFEVEPLLIGLGAFEEIHHLFSTKVEDLL